MRSEGMAQRMWRNPLANARPDGITPDQIPERLPGHGCPTSGNEQRIPLPAAENFRTGLLQIPPHPSERLLAYRHQSFLAPLANDAHHAHVLAQLSKRHGHEFRYSQAAGVK